MILYACFLYCFSFKLIPFCRQCPYKTNYNVMNTNEVSLEKIISVKIIFLKTLYIIKYYLDPEDLSVEK